MAKKNVGNDILDQERQLEQSALAMQEIQALEEQTKIMQQENMNKQHDEEFTYNAEREDLGIIKENDIAKAYQTLIKYKEDLADKEAKIIQNEEFWKMNHWNTMSTADDKRVKPRSAWLVNLIMNKHADAMDNYPDANILPRNADDEETCKVLSSVIPVILEQNDYESTYSDCQWYKGKNGTSFQGVFWNNDKNNGLGDVEIKKIDALNLFWKFDVSDIQDSPNVFHVSMMENEQIKEMYPDIKVGQSGSMGIDTTEKYLGKADTTDQTAIIDWYYKKRVEIRDEMGVPKINTVLHYCKFCNGQIIYSSENDPNFTDRGWYDHGLYPFVPDTLFPVEKSVMGIGYIDIEKDNQLYIDKLQQAILESAIVNARPRYFIRNDGAVNEEEFMDISKPMIHVDGNLGQDSIIPVMNSAFNSVYETVYLNKVQELKDTSGNTASSQGQASSVTSASGIASLQEAAGKLSRDANKTSYRAFKQVVYLVIELIRQFYNEPRCFRIAGEMGKNEFVSFDNSGLMPQSQGSALGIDLGSRLPIVDIEVVPQKRSAYSKESQNQTAMSLYSAGFFAPNNADAALACLEMMEFEDIDKVKENVQKNGTLLQLVMQMQQQITMYQQQLMQLGIIVDNQNGTNIAAGIAGEADQTRANVARAASSGTTGRKGSTNQSKGSLSSQAATATRSSTAPQ